jgi:hypothetical protein
MILFDSVTEMVLALLAGSKKITTSSNKTTDTDSGLWFGSDDARLLRLLLLLSAMIDSCISKKLFFPPTREKVNWC